MTDMLAKAKELNEKRTQGKWRHGIHGFHDFVICENEEVVSEDASPYDSRFIAFAPEFFDWAIAEIEELKCENLHLISYKTKLEAFILENNKLRLTLDRIAESTDSLGDIAREALK